MTPTTPEDKYGKFSCPNLECSLFNKTGRGNITHRSWTGKHKHIERLRCTVCDGEFSEREGTLMSHTKLQEEKVIRLLKCQRWGVCDDGTADICEVDIKTLHRFQAVSSRRAKTHHEQVVKELEVSGVQLDEMHSKRRPGQVEWIHTALAIGSMFVLWVGFGERTTQTASYLIAQVVARLRQVPIFLTDCWKAYPKALIRVLGRLYRPRRKGKVGRKPTPRLVAPDHLFYAQVVKIRDRAGRVVEVTSRVAFGGSRRFFKQLSLRGLGTTIQTAFMERFYGTLRGLVAALRRRTRCLSWSEDRHSGRVWLIVSLYNFVIPHKSLRQGRVKRTPAMVIGLADHIWSYREYVWLRVHHDPLLQKEMDERIQQLLTPALPNAIIELTPVRRAARGVKKKHAELLKKAA